MSLSAEKDIEIIEAFRLEIHFNNITNDFIY